MKVLVTGASGFIGKNVCLWLKNNNHDILPIDIDNINQLKEYVNKCDFIIHLAGINRPLTKEEFYDGNTNLTKRLVDLVKESKKNIPILFSSSIQATLDNDYGIRCLMQGYQNVLVHNSFIIHLGSKRFGKRTDFIIKSDKKRAGGRNP